MINSVRNFFFSASTPAQGPGPTQNRRTSPTLPHGAAPSAGTRAHGGSGTAVKRRLFRKNKARKIAEKLLKDAARSLNAYQASPNGRQYPAEQFDMAVTAAIIGVPQLNQDEVLAISVIDELVKRGEVPVKLRDLAKKATGVIREIEERNLSLPGNAERASEPRSIYQARHRTAPHPNSRSQELVMGQLPVSGSQLRSHLARGNFRQTAGNPPPYSEYPEDHTLDAATRRMLESLPDIDVPPDHIDAETRRMLETLPDIDVPPDHLDDETRRMLESLPDVDVPPDHLDQEAQLLMERFPILDTIPMPSSRQRAVDVDVALASLRQDQRDQAEDLIPPHIQMHRENLQGLATFDEDQERQATDQWLRAMRLLVYCRDNLTPAASPEGAATVAQRQSTLDTPAGTLAAGVDPKELKARKTPGGGDCLIHALQEGKTGRAQSVGEVFVTRREMAGMRSRLPERPLDNRAALVAALNDSAPQDDPAFWDKMIPDVGIPNSVLAEFEKCPGFYENTDGIKQWTLLPDNEDRTVLAIDGGYKVDLDGQETTIAAEVLAFRNGERVACNEELTQARVNELLRQGVIILFNDHQARHWQSLSL
jgi:hypothetical protein